jgi:hypothetical protein
MPLIDEVNAVTEQLFIPKLVDNFFGSNVLMSRMKERGRSYQGGTKITQPVLYAQNSNFKFYSGWDTLNIDPTTEVTAAQFDWRQASISIAIDRLTELKNSGAQAVLDLVSTKMQVAEKTMIDQMGTYLYTGIGGSTGSKELDGLNMMVNDGTYNAVYGAIDRTANTWWKSNYSATTGITSTLIRIQKKIGLATVGKSRPDLAMCTQAIFDDVWALSLDKQRIVNQTDADNGFQSVRVSGLDFVVDDKCPSYDADNDWVYLLNTEYIDFVTHSDEDFRFEPWHMHLDKNGRVAKIHWAGNLTGSNPRMQTRYVAAITNT